MSDLSAQINEIDLISLVGRDTVLKPARWNREFRGCCPIHHGDNPTAFVVYYNHEQERWRYKCYACGASGDALNYYIERFGGTTADALHALTTQTFPNKPLPPRQLPKTLPPRHQAIVTYHNNLHLQTSTGTTAWEFWKTQGLSAKTITRFQLGYAQACPLMKTSDSLTIPVTYRDQVLNIRHRLLQPTNPKDKYRPQKAGLGAHLFNQDSLDLDGQDVLIVEGEKKTLVLVDRGMESCMPVVSATTGVASWLGGYGTDWYELLMDVRRVYVLFDNEASTRPIAERTAKLFGKRGYVVHVPGKVDDFLQLDEEETLPFLLDKIGLARPVLRSRWY